MLTIKEDCQIDKSSRLIQFLGAEIIFNFKMNIKIRAQIIYQNRIGNHLFQCILKTHLNKILDKIQNVLIDQIFNYLFIR